VPVTTGAEAGADFALGEVPADGLRFDAAMFDAADDDTNWFPGTRTPESYSLQKQRDEMVPICEAGRKSVLC
jgi:hypothetical protein